MGVAVRLVQGKMLLPFYDVFDEQRYFEPAKEQELVTVRGQRVAITVCEDAWNDKGYWPRRRYAVDPVERLMEGWTGDGVKVILNISASPFWEGKREERRGMLGGAGAAAWGDCGYGESGGGERQFGV